MATIDTYVDETAETGRHLVKSAERTVRILETLAASGEFRSLAELQKLTGYPRSSLYELLQTLRALRWIDTADDGLAFGIGPHALLAGTGYLDRDPALPLAVRQLELLRAELGYTAHFARLDGAHVIYLATRETLEPRQVVSRVGRQLPAHATALGLALLAEKTSTEVDEVLPEQLAALTAKTTTSRERLEVELSGVRSAGYAVEREQNTLGISCVAVAVPYRIPATDAISCSLPLASATDDEIERVSSVMMRHAAELSRTLKHKGIR
ncbi:IclR family transcriptional regulator [Microbacterium sp. STN6]|uniref:IclR family transcriptional regulator n=1 Tax=Microbacterium sp. STN6 TaxID=2995588 RepID=UPI002260B7C8|nr:IclR family transcriptional regulator [Microbacterium sp. STN6]MCX7522506.1 IclR family transcriptional regulator [Microbacterium sp. STN6]